METVSTFKKLSFLDALLSFYYNYKEWTLEESEKGLETISVEQLMEEIDSKFEESLGTTLEYNYKEWSKELSKQRFEHVEYLLMWTDFTIKAFTRDDLTVLVWKIDSVPLFKKLYSEEINLKDYMLKAVESDSSSIFQYLISLGADPTLDDSVVMITACRRGYLDIVKYLFETGRVDEELAEEDITEAALSSGNLELIKYLFDTVKVDVGIIDDDIEQACTDGDLELVKYLISKSEDDFSYIPKFILYGVPSGNLELIKYLISLGGEEDSYQGGQVLLEAVRFSSLEVVKYLIEELKTLENPVESLVVSNVEFLEASIESKNIKMVRYMEGIFHTLRDTTVSVKNDLLEMAVQSGTVDIIKYIIRKGNVNPRFERDYPFKEAINTGEVDKIRFFIEEYKLPLHLIELGLRHSINEDVVLYLLSLPGVRPSFSNNVVLKNAIKNRSVGVIDFLISYEGEHKKEIDLNVSKGEILISILEEKRYDILYKLLEEERFVIDLQTLKVLASKSKLKVLKCVVESLDKNFIYDPIITFH